MKENRKCKSCDKEIEVKKEEYQQGKKPELTTSVSIKYGMCAKCYRRNCGR